MARLIGLTQELSTDQIAIRRALATCAVPHDAMRVAADKGIDGRVALFAAVHMSLNGTCATSQDRGSTSAFGRNADIVQTSPIDQI
jgi:hypothetical protein